MVSYNIYVVRANRIKKQLYLPAVNHCKVHKNAGTQDCNLWLFIALLFCWCRSLVLFSLSRLQIKTCWDVTTSWSVIELESSRTWQSYVSVSQCYKLHVSYIVHTDDASLSIVSNGHIKYEYVTTLGTEPTFNTKSAIVRAADINVWNVSSTWLDWGSDSLVEVEIKRYVSVQESYPTTGHHWVMFTGPTRLILKIDLLTLTNISFLLLISRWAMKFK